MVAPLVAQVIVTLCAVSNALPAGENVGVATMPGAGGLYGGTLTAAAAPASCVAVALTRT